MLLCSMRRAILRLIFDKLVTCAEYRDKHAEIDLTPTIRERTDFFTLAAANPMDQVLLHTFLSVDLERERHRDPRRLTRYGRKVYSQNDEDGIIAEIFARIGVEHRSLSNSAQKPGSSATQPGFSCRDGKVCGSKAMQMLAKQLPRLTAVLSRGAV